MSTEHSHNRDDSYTSLTDLLTADQLAAVGKAINTIAEHLDARPVDWAHPENATCIYQLPVTHNQLCLLSRLLAPALSDGYAFEDTRSCMADHIHKAIRTVHCAASTGITAVPFASLYRIRRTYGGPEEGGWWYNAWSLDSTTALDCDSDEDILARLNPLLEPYQNRFAQTPEDREATSPTNLLRIYHQFILDPDSEAAQEVFRNYKADGGYDHKGDWNHLPLDTRDVCIYHAPYDDDSIWLVFEWTPGSAATYVRPHYS